MGKAGTYMQGARGSIGEFVFQKGANGRTIQRIKVIPRKLRPSTRW